MVAIIAVLVHDVMYMDGHSEGKSCPRKAIIIMAVLVHDITYENGHSVMGALVHRV